MNESKVVAVVSAAICFLMAFGPAQAQTEEPEANLSAMVTDLGCCEAHQESPNVRAVATLLQAARRLDQSNAKAALLLAESLETLGDVEGTAAALDAYLQAGGDDEVVVAKRIFLAAELQQTNEQRRGLLMNISQEPTVSTTVKSVVLQELARLSFEASDDQMGQSTLSEAIKADPYNIAARQKVLDLMGDETPVPQRLPLLAQMVRANPLRLDIVWRFANALDQMGLHGDAQTWYKYALGVHIAGAGVSGISTDELLDLASSYVMSADYQAAMKVLDRIVDRSPDRVDVQIWLARAKAGMGDKAQADKHLAAAERLLLGRAQRNPSDPSATVQTAWFYLIDKPDAAQAQSWAQKAVELAPENTKAQLCRELAAVAAGTADEETMAMLQDLAMSEPWARIGAIRLLLAGEHTQEELGQALYTSMNYHPGGWVGLALRELAASQDMALPIDQYLTEIRQMLAGQLGNAAELRDFYRHPQDYIFLKIRPQKPSINYNEPLILDVSLTNMGSHAITMGPGMMLNPRLLLSAKLTGGVDKDLKYFDFVSMYERRLLKPREGLSTTVRVDRGEFGMLLRQIPQETVTIRLSCMLDPQPLGENEYLPSLAGQVSKDIVVVRHGFRPTSRAVNKLYGMSKDGPMRTRVFAALLMGDLLANNQFPGRVPGARPPQGVDQNKISEILDQTAQDSNWRVRAWVAEAVRNAHLDPQLGESLADQIGDEHWFVRLMAVRAAGQRGRNWTDILRHVAQTDEDPLVRQMAEAYVGSDISRAPK